MTRPDARPHTCARVLSIAEPFEPAMHQCAYLHPHARAHKDQRFPQSRTEIVINTIVFNKLNKGNAMYACFNNFKVVSFLSSTEVSFNLGQFT